MHEPLICGHQLQASRTLAIPYTSLTRIGICALSASKHIIYLKGHNDINLQEVITSSLDQWNLDSEKQVAITTDSGANIKVVACELLGW